MGDSSRRRRQRHQEGAAAAKSTTTTAHPQPQLAEERGNVSPTSAPPQTPQAAKRVESQAVVTASSSSRQTPQTGKRPPPTDKAAAKLTGSLALPAHDPIEASVYKWAAAVGLGQGKKVSELLVAIQDIQSKRRVSWTITFWLPNGEERFARARDSDGKVLLELISEEEANAEFEGFDEYEEYDGQTDTVSVNLNGRIMAMFDRNGMKWDTALRALIRDGEITLSPEQKTLVQTGDQLKGHPAWFELRRAMWDELQQWIAAGNPILKAARAKAGEGKTSDIKAARLLSLAARLGKKVEIPAGSREAYHLERNLTDEYNARKGNGTLPPTDRQISYAKELASRCKIEVPGDALATFKACSDFIEHHKKLAPPSERQLQFARSLAGNTPLPDDVLKSSKACSDWIDSHDPERAEGPFVGS
jgi:hypothetical protein